MNASELQTWLLDVGVHEELTNLACRTAALEFDNLIPSELIATKSEIDWKRLMLAGSILARAKSRAMEEAALRIATATFILSEDSRVRDAGALLLEELSNYRAIELAESRGKLEKGLTSRLGITARIESLHRMVASRVLEGHSGAWLQVNHFQENFWDEASSDRVWLSASAPTASGKTYLVQRWLLDQLISTEISLVVYLAPTRALVAEIEESLTKTVAGFGKSATVIVSSVPSREQYQAAAHEHTKTIFVLTQERLHLLANAVGGSVNVNILVVDEAHKIGDSGRGIILQDAIERVARGNDSLKVVFISPATKNPEVLLDDAPPEVKRRAIESDSPTVLQNLILAAQVRGKTDEWNLTLRSGGLYPLGVLVLPNRATSVKKKIAFIAAAAGTRGGTLIYSNGAAEAEEIALLISQLVTPLPASEENDTPPADGNDDLPSVDEELEDLAALARHSVHSKYALADFVKKGVAFHYGNMPSIIRLEIERLFRAGKIRFLVCTSTLVEGVNLPCRTIVVRGPRKGRGRPMSAPDFWNLAGRAGRWGNEFQGNIICVDSSNTSVWPGGVPERSRYPIIRESDEVLAKKSELEAFLAARELMSMAEVSASAELEQVGAYLISTYMRSGTIANTQILSRHEASYVHRLDAIVSGLAKNIEIPVEMVVRHPGVSAVGMQRLLLYFRSLGDEVGSLILPQPAADSAVEDLTKIMNIINNNVFPAFTPDSAALLNALIVNQWLRGFPLSLIISKRLEYNRRRGKAIKLSAVIRSTMELVEQVARFKAPKYLSAYMDVLRLYLNSVGKSDLLQDQIDLAVALEFGISTRTLLSLMEIGLSRTTAVALSERIAMDNLTKAECKAWVENNFSVVETLGLPGAMLREMRYRFSLPESAV